MPLATKEARAEAARRRYHENLPASRERCRVSKATARRADPDEAPGSVYDADSYAAEWMFLSMSGVRSDEIIARCRPSRDWFVRQVMPLVTRSVCAYCGAPFNPQTSGMLTRCSYYCGSTAAR